MHPNTPPPLLSTEFANRLVTLCDGRPGLRAGLLTEILTAPNPPPVTPKVPGADPATAPPPAILEFVSSTAALDRFHEIISPAGWRLESYRRNPVFQNAHQYGDIIFTLGKALVTEVREVAGRPALYQKIEFAVEANPMARLAYALYKGKFLNAVSVGFIPLRWENGTAEAGYRRKYLEQELLEVSAVGIPANPEALQLGLRSGAVAKADVRELLELLQPATGRRSQEPGARSQERAAGDASRGSDHLILPEISNCKSQIEDGNAVEGVATGPAQLLELARALRQLLRSD